MPNKLVTVAKYFEMSSALAARIKLESQGVGCFIADEQLAASFPFALGGIRLQVWESDAEKAEEILAESEASAGVDEAESAGSEEE